jgi:hypothetical protein
MRTTSRLVFLLGSGISKPANLPLTNELTGTVLAGNRYTGRCHESFSICSFLAVLRDTVEGCFQELNRSSNYEDLYYVCSQLTGHNSRNFENPVIVPFVQQLLAHLRSRCPDATEKNLYDLAAEAIPYIADVVARELCKRPTTLNHLSFIYDAYVNPRCGTIDIFTLNHDCLVETYMRSKGVDFVDGFGEPAPRVRYWDPHVFQNKDSKVNFFKLHGSLDWYRLRPDGDGWEQEAVGIPLDGDPFHAQSKDGRLLLAMDGRPHILIGTFNKMLEYTGGIFLDLLCQLRHRLRLTTHLVVCGYGFADKGINTQLVEWIYSDVANRICVVHPQPDILVNSARGAIRNKWQEWIADGRVVVVPRGVERVTFEEIREALANAS